MIQTTSLIWPKTFLGQLWTLFGSKKTFGVWGAPTNSFSTIRKFCHRGVFEEKSRFLQIFTNLSKVPNGFLRDTLQVMRAYESKRKMSHPKRYVYTPGTPFLRLQKNHFFGPQKGNILTKNFFCVCLTDANTRLERTKLF